MDHEGSKALELAQPHDRLIRERNNESKSNYWSFFVKRGFLMQPQALSAVLLEATVARMR